MIKGIIAAVVFFIVWFAMLGLIMGEEHLPPHKKILYGLYLLKNYIAVFAVASFAAFIFVLLFGNFRPY